MTPISIYYTYIYNTEIHKIKSCFSDCVYIFCLLLLDVFTFAYTCRIWVADNTDYVLFGQGLITQMGMLCGMLYKNMLCIT